MPPIRPVRRGQLISPWGIGAMIDFPKDESLMTCGLDVWPMASEKCPEELLVTEERLQKRLGVTHFRLPPEFRDPGSGVQHPNLRIPFMRFPQWHYCPKCGAMEKLSIFGGRQRCKGPNYADGMSCHATAPNRRPWLIPVRFVAICGRGHIEDFPFMEWVHREKAFDESHKLRLRAGRSASTLSGIKITCSCREQYSMAGAFNPHSMDKVKQQGCGGHRPWLGKVEDEKVCGHELHVVQRGASNVYFPEVRSSIYLPQWESSVDRKIVEVLENRWSLLTRGLVDGKIDRVRVEVIAEQYNIDPERLMEAALKRFENSSSPLDDENDSEETYRKSEYDAVLSCTGGDNQDFYVTRKSIDEYQAVINQCFNSISLIHKLRETRVLAGFSRFLPDDGRLLQEKIADLSVGNIDWLPAIVVRGEGIFFEFDRELIEEWGNRRDVAVRTNLLIKNFNDARKRRGQVPRPLNSRFILLHTFAHIIINQLSFECGYGSSAIRERIYCNTENAQNSMNGVLIYTASGDSEGSMGGLVRQGIPGNLEGIISTALNSAEWCSSDPVCMQSHGQGPDSCNLAACHSCALLSETCCEEGNRLLDRALIVGTLNQRDLGYFSGLLGNINKISLRDTDQLDFTDSHEKCMEGIEKHFKVSFEKVGNCEYTSNDNQYRVICLFSKKYLNKNYTRYWYSFRPNQKTFLDESEESYIAFGCGSPNRIVLMNKTEFYPLLERMRTTGSDKNLYWHVELFDKDERIFIISRQPEKGKDITEYLISNSS